MIQGEFRVLVHHGPLYNNRNRWCSTLHHSRLTILVDSRSGSMYEGIYRNRTVSSQGLTTRNRPLLQNSSPQHGRCLRSHKISFQVVCSESVTLHNTRPMLCSLDPSQQDSQHLRQVLVLFPLFVCLSLVADRQRKSCTSPSPALFPHHPHLPLLRLLDD